MGKPKKDVNSKKRPSRIEDAIRDEINRRDLSDYAVAKNAGVNYDSVNRFLKGKQRVSMDIAERIVESLWLQVTFTPGQPPTNENIPGADNPDQDI